MKWDRLWGTLAVLFTIGGYCLASIASSTLLYATDVYSNLGPWKASDLPGALLWLAGAVACFFAGTYFEGGPRRWHGPMSALVGGFILVLIGANAAGVIIPAQAQASRSGYTQSNGVPDRATVTAVNGGGACSSHTCNYETQVSVHLREPVSGEVGSTVYVPALVRYTDGQSIAVAVNPKAPAYAELPGQPYETVGAVIRNGVFGAIALAFGITGIVLGLRMRRREFLLREAR